MEAKFKKGQSVRITKRNGEIIDGIVRDWDYNICTFVENIKSLDPLLYS